MKIIVISRSGTPSALRPSNVDKIKETALNVGAEVCFVASESEVPAEFADAEIIYGFGMNIAHEN